MCRPARLLRPHLWLCCSATHPHARWREATNATLVFDPARAGATPGTQRAGLALWRTPPGCRPCWRVAAFFLYYIGPFCHPAGALACPSQAPACLALAGLTAFLALASALLCL
jgi:hypothetical protein